MCPVHDWAHTYEKGSVGSRELDALRRNGGFAQPFKKPIPRIPQHISFVVGAISPKPFVRHISVNDVWGGGWLWSPTPPNAAGMGWGI